MRVRWAVVLLGVPWSAGCWGPSTTYVTPSDYGEVLGRGAPSVALGLHARNDEWSEWHDRLACALASQTRLLRVERAVPADSPKRVDVVMDIQIEEKFDASARRRGGATLDRILTIGTLGIYALLGGSTTRVDRTMQIEVRYWYNGRTFYIYSDHVHVDGAVNLLYGSADEHHRTLERIVNEAILYDLLKRAVPNWTRR